MIRPWTKADVAMVRRDWRAGVSRASTAKALGRSVESVRRQQLKLGITTPNALRAAMAERFNTLRGNRAYEAMEAAKARAITQTANRDAAYVSAVMALGGFCAFSETRRQNGPSVICTPCLPMIWPDRSEWGRAA